MNKEKRLINLRTFNGNLLCKYMLMYFATESVWMYYFVTLTIHSPYLTEPEFSSQKYIKICQICQIFVKYLSNICQICKAFVKYVNYWMHEDSFQNGMHIICILSCFLNIGRSKILDLKEAQIGLIFLHKWNGMDWRFFNEEEKCDIGTVDLLSWNILQIYTNYMFSCISSLL